MYAGGPHSIAGDDDDDYVVDNRQQQRRQQMPLKNNNGGLVAYDLEADEMSDQVMQPQQQQQLNQLHQLHHQKIKSLNRRQQQQQQHPYYPSGSMSRIHYDPQLQLPRNYYSRPQQYGTVGGGAGRRRSSADRRK